MSLDRTLADIQRIFRDTVLSADDAPLSSVLERGQDAGIAVYRTTVQRSLVKALGATFPVVQRIIGPKAFSDLAQRFVITAPPRAAYLSAYGADFANFIVGDNDATARAPYLSGVARLEWARADSYFAADAAPLDSARLTNFAPDSLEGLILHLHPATRLIVSRFPILRIWEVNQPEIADVPRVDMAEAETVLVTRPDAQVVTRKLTPGDAAFIVAVMSGETLGEAAEAALAAQSDFNLQAALEAHFVNATLQDA